MGLTTGYGTSDAVVVGAAQVVLVGHKVATFQLQIVAALTPHLTFLVNNQVVTGLEEMRNLFNLFYR